MGNLIFPIESLNYCVTGASKNLYLGVSSNKALLFQGRGRWWHHTPSPFQSAEETKQHIFFFTFKYSLVWKCSYVVVGRWSLIRQMHYWFKLPPISVHPWLEVARADKREEDSGESMLTWRLLIAFVLQFVIAVSCWAYNEAYTFR